jgi:very-short-patch-repair endonuclease
MNHQPSQNAAASAWLKRHASKVQNPFERLFVSSVLAHVPGINFDCIEPQFQFQDSDGRTRYCDFVIQEGNALRVAIEVDGYDKTGRGVGMTHLEFIDWQRRHASLVAQGWNVIRFANKDVRTASRRCIEHLTLLLRQERGKSDYLNSLVSRERALLADLAQQSATSQTLREELDRVQTLVSAAGDNAVLTDQEKERLSQLQSAQTQVQYLKGETRLMKTTIWAFVVVIVAMMYFMFQHLARPTDQPLPVAAAPAAPVPVASLPSPTLAANTPTSNPAPTEPGRSCANPLDWQTAKRYEGQQTAFVGKVAQVTVRRGVTGSPTFIDLGAAFPSKGRLTAVIWGADAGLFNSDLARNLAGRTVCVQGRVGSRDGVAQIVLKKRDQLVYK